MNNKKKNLLILLVAILGISLIAIGTYAIFNTELLTGNNSISSGQIKMSYTETNEIGMNNALPMKDEEGKLLTNYFDFSVLSYIKTRTNDSTVRKLNYNIILEPINVNNPLGDNEIKVYLTMVKDGVESVVLEPTTINNLNNYILKSQEETFSNNKGEVVTNYRLRSWLDSNVDANKLSKNKYSYKFRVNVNNDVIKETDYALDFATDNVGKNGLVQVDHVIDNTLQVDDRFKTEYRYRGSNVNNYVTFNNELWRIIGIIPVEDNYGNVKNRFKIIKDSSAGYVNISNISDVGENEFNYKYTYNDMNVLLGGYLNKNSYETLSEEAKKMVGTTKYYLGGYYTANTDTLTNSLMWQYERKNGNGSSCVFEESGGVTGDCYFYNGGSSYAANPTTMNSPTRKVSLMHISDYMYSFDGCYDIPMSDSYTSTDLESCIASKGWMSKNEPEWTMTPNVSDGDIFWSIMENNSISGSHVYFSGSQAYRSVLYLDAKVKISGGNGTSSTPYTLSF